GDWSSDVCSSDLRVAGPVGLATGAGRAGGATGVVAMTWISGSFVALELPLELEASCAATVLGAIASTAASAQSVPHAKMRPRCRWLNDTTPCMCNCHAGPVEWCHRTDAC